MLICRAIPLQLYQRQTYLSSKKSHEKASDNGHASFGWIFQPRFLGSRPADRSPARAFFPIHACISDLCFSCTSISGIILAGSRYLGVVATRPRPSSARDVAKNRHHRTKKAVASIIFFKK
jgi:hypothetical protein